MPVSCGVVQSTQGGCGILTSSHPGGTMIALALLWHSLHASQPSSSLPLSLAWIISPLFFTILPPPPLSPLTHHTWCLDELKTTIVSATYVLSYCTRIFESEGGEKKRGSRGEREVRKATNVTTSHDSRPSHYFLATSWPRPHLHTSTPPHLHTSTPPHLHTSTPPSHHRDKKSRMDIPHDAYHAPMSCAWLHVH